MIRNINFPLYFFFRRWQDRNHDLKMLDGADASAPADYYRITGSQFFLGPEQFCVDGRGNDGDFYHLQAALFRRDIRFPQSACAHKKHSEKLGWLFYPFPFEVGRTGIGKPDAVVEVKDDVRATVKRALFKPARAGKECLALYENDIVFAEGRSILQSLSECLEKNSEFGE